MTGLAALCLTGLLAMAPDNGPDQGADAITVYGNTRTRLAVLRRELRTDQDSLATAQRLLADRRWLLRQRLFQRVEVALSPGTSNGLRRVVWTVQERGCLSLAPLASLDSRHGLSLGVEATVRNALGRMERLQLSAQAGGQPRIGARLILPQAATALGLYAQTEADHDAASYRYPDEPVPFEWTVNQLALTLGRRWGRWIETEVSWGWRHDRCGVEGVTFTGNRTENSTLTEARLRVDTRDWPVYPRTGWMAEAFVKRIAANGDRSLGRIGGALRAYRPLGGNILALEAVGQWSDGPCPPIHRLRLGGSQSLRSLRTGALSGDHLVHGSLEYRMPVVYARQPEAGLNAGWALVLFADVGSVWADGDRPDWRHAAGLGVHAIWDSWVLRAEYGYHGQGWGFVSAGTGVKF